MNQKQKLRWLRIKSKFTFLFEKNICGFVFWCLKNNLKNPIFIIIF